MYLKNAPDTYPRGSNNPQFFKSSKTLIPKLYKETRRKVNNFWLFLLFC